MDHLSEGVDVPIYSWLLILCYVIQSFAVTCISVEGYRVVISVSCDRQISQLASSNCCEAPCEASIHSQYIQKGSRFAIKNSLLVEVSKLLPEVF